MLPTRRLAGSPAHAGLRLVSAVLLHWAEWGCGMATIETLELCVSTVGAARSYWPARLRAAVEAARGVLKRISPCYVWLRA